MARVLAAATVVALTLAGAAAGRSAATVVSVISTATSEQQHDTGKKGPSVGDYVVMTDRLTNAVRQFGKPRGAVVGTDRAVERLIAGGGVRIEGTTKLPGGTVRVSGLLRTDAQGRANAPVVGGTGRYDGATGTLTVVNLTSAGNVALNVYSLNLLPVT
jgi:hypothetical protein